METTSVIILNGFLGAGKTTLLKNLLIQAHEKQLSVSVIVNDMSELDVDGVLIANTDIVDAKDNNFVSITADSISSPAGLKKMDLAINHLLDHNKPDVMLIETSGSSHPLPLVKYLRRHSRVRLKAFLTLVDTVMLHEDYNDGKKLIPTLQENLRHNKRGLENLLAEQIMFCNRLLLTRNDRLPFDIISAVAKAIHPLNPSVDVLAVSWGNIELSTLLAIPDYNFDRVELLISELEALVGNMDTPCNNEELIWRVIRTTGHSIRKDYGIPVTALWAWAFIAVKVFFGSPGEMILPCSGISQQEASVWRSLATGKLEYWNILTII